PFGENWSRQIIWGSHRLTGGIIKPTGNAWPTTTVWGSAKTLTSTGDNIVWGTSFSVAGDNIVWGTSRDGDNVVWGTDCGGADCDNIMWGTSDGDNVVWGTAMDGDNIVWGTARLDGDNIVWGTSSGDNLVWGTSADTDVAGDVVFSDDPADLLPSLNIDFSTVVPLVPAPTTLLGATVSIGGL